MKVLSLFQDKVRRGTDWEWIFWLISFPYVCGELEIKVGYE